VAREHGLAKITPVFRARDRITATKTFVHTHVFTMGAIQTIRGAGLYFVGGKTVGDILEQVNGIGFRVIVAWGGLSI